MFVADAEAGVVDVYDTSGNYLTQFGAGELEGVGIGVDEATGTVYVADDFANEVFVYKPDGSGGYAPIGEWNGRLVAKRGFWRSSWSRGR